MSPGSFMLLATHDGILPQLLARCACKPPRLHCLCCVRRAFLCGDDEFSGKNFDHRRQWIEDRIRLLAESFAVSVHSYAVAPTTQHGWFAEGKKTMRSVE